MAEFKIQVDCCWEKATKKFQVFEQCTEEKTFNKITVTGDDFKYDYVDEKV